MIRMCKQLVNIMERRRVPCLNRYFDQIQMSLWPRFKYLFDANVKSIQNAKIDVSVCDK